MRAVKTPRLASADACASSAASSEIELKAAHLGTSTNAAAAAADSQPAARPPPQISWRRHVLRSAKVLTYLVLWYAISITLTLYNKWLFAFYGLKFPLLVTSLHIFLKVPACRLCMYIFSVPTVKWSGARGVRVLLLEVMPSGVATAADIGLSNLSYLFITVTYYTIIKSSVPIWIMAFSAFYGLLKLRPSLVGVILCIVGGIVLTTLHEGDDDASGLSSNATNATLPALARQLRRRLHDGGDAETPDPLLGSLLVLGASLSAGFRWAATQMLLTSRAPPPGASPAAAAAAQDAARPRRKPRTPYWEGLNPLTLLYYSMPFGFLALLPLACALEMREAISYFASIESGWQLIEVCLLLSIGGFLAFFLLLAELRVVQLSSGLTLSVAGIFKEVLTVACSAIFLGDHLTLWNVGGLGLCIIGIGMYNRIRLLESAEEEVMDTDDSRHSDAFDSASLRHVQPVDR